MLMVIFCRTGAELRPLWAVLVMRRMVMLKRICCAGAVFGRFGLFGLDPLAA